MRIRIDKYQMDCLLPCYSFFFLWWLVIFLANFQLCAMAPVEVLEANLVEPGRFLILLAGGVAEVEESMGAVDEHHGPALLSRMLLPFVHPGLMGRMRVGDGSAGRHLQ